MLERGRRNGDEALEESRFVELRLKGVWLQSICVAKGTKK